MHTTRSIFCIGFRPSDLKGQIAFYQRISTMNTQREKCPLCDSEDVKQIRKALKKTKNGRKETVPDMPMLHCNNCGENTITYETQLEMEKNWLRSKRNMPAEV